MTAEPSGRSRKTHRTSTRKTDPGTPRKPAKRENPVNPDLLSLHRALQVVRRSVAPDITVQRLLILLAVYANEGLSQRELLSKLDGCSITEM